MRTDDMVPLFAIVRELENTYFEHLTSDVDVEFCGKLSGPQDGFGTPNLFVPLRNIVGHRDIPFSWSISLLGWSIIRRKANCPFSAQPD